MTNATDIPVLDFDLSQIPASYRHDRVDAISAAVRMLLRETVDLGTHFGSETARDQARARVAEVNDILDNFLPI